MIVLFNPTDDEFSAQYGGVTITIPPYGQDGHMVKYEDAKARHILNQLSPRGLTTLEYGDEGEIKKKKATDGRKRNIDFKKKQIAVYNRDNESRQNRHLEYVEPPDYIKEWAKDLGLALKQPYDVQDVKNEEISELRAELKKRDKQIDTLTDQVSQLLESMKKEQPEQEQEPTDAERLLAEFKAMNRQTLRSRVKDLKEEGYKNLPVEVQTFIRERWGEFFDKEEVFPY